MIINNTFRLSSSINTVLPFLEIISPPLSNFLRININKCQQKNTCNPPNKRVIRVIIDSINVYNTNTNNIY